MSDSIWISPFIEHCLSSYQTEENFRPDHNLTWEDDGSNIRFPSSVQHNALINDWNEGDSLPTAKLTDSDTQIDAILSRGSLDEYNRAFPQEPLSKNGCRGFLIQLVMFELVYEYSTGKPNVHLYVKRFNIIWDRGKNRSPPTGRVVRKKPALVSLMKQVYARTKSREQQARKQYKADIGSNGNVGTVPPTQTTNGHTYASTQAQLVSQLPSHLSVIESDHDPVYDAPLARNAPRPESPESLRPSRETTTETRLLNRPSAAVAAEHSRDTRSVSITSDKLPDTPQTQESREATESRSSPVKRNVESGLPGSQLGTSHSSIKEVRSPANGDPDPPEQTIERRDSPYSPEKQLNSHLQASQSVTYRPRNPATIANQTIVDPWEGWTEIQTIDVTVPEDQKELLEHRSKGQWYPPLPGQPSVSGHVPPAILHEWNRIVFQRSQRPTGSRSKSPETDGPSDHNTPSDSTSSTSDIEWDQSPERTPRRGLVLPLDSSPNMGQSVPHAPRQMSPDAQESTLKGTSPKLHGAANENHSPFEASQEQDHGPIANTEMARTRPMETGAIYPTMAHGNGGHDPGISSSDSEMDVCEPQPLSGSTQYEVSSQMEPEISSSSPPTPESSRHIQVVETPSAVLHKSRATIFSQNDAELGSTNAEFSSQTNKSSSQSRILNTYASHDGHSRGEPSQGSSKSALTQGEHNVTYVQVVDTPISGQALQMHNSASQSQPDSLLASSAPKSTELSIPFAVSTYQSQSSNAFSSYREIPSSSMLSVEEEQQSPGIQSFAHASPLMPTRSLPLKRLASEIGDDGGTSPSKRNKFDQKLRLPESETGVDAKVCYRNFRFQECINSAESIAAKKVYEKFCSDYPAYHGDFAHFTEMCSKLQAFRARGSLQRSFLWDDFIIKHLEDYPAYLGECMAKETKSLPYEEFFAVSFSRPTYKKRSFGAEAIDACAAQVITIDEQLAVTSSDPTTDIKGSFTSSIRDQVSNFHTYSFAATQEPESQDAQFRVTQGDNDTTSEYSIPDSEPIRAAAREVVQETTQGPDNDEIMEDAEDMNDTAHETASVELGDEESARDRTAPSDDDAMGDPLGDSLAKEASLALEVAPGDQPEKSVDHATIADVEDEDDGNNEHEIAASNLTQHARAQIDEKEDDPNPAASAYETAEIEETQDDGYDVARDAAANVNADEVEEVVEDEVEKTTSNSDEVDPDDPNENWFLSLSHLRPNKPVWSDDANTPFKKWARADQNVFSVRQRRGGVNISTDEKGVIKRVHHEQR
ncbi:hypothetical protein BJX63DRAFT_215810 [Aspergillus granulosus]|uniref:Telomere replication protein EST3 n=1 Tax=Aspergillus granulosus TaxID=176169 RepID=A0ABR4HDR4_9EURO